MKVVSISRVRDEVDIIESFVRHNAKFVDLMLIVDDSSIDGTSEILTALQVEGLPLSIQRAAVLGSERELLFAGLMRECFERHGADWIVFLDADEFIEVDSNTLLADLLYETPNSLVKIRWNNFAWHEHYDQTKSLIFEKLVLRQLPRFGHEKIIVPRSLGLNTAYRPSMGNHDLIANDAAIAGTYLSAARLCHFPVRSLQQFKTKAAIGHLQYVVRGARDPACGVQYQEVFRVMRLGDEASIAPVLRTLSERYPPFPSDEPDGIGQFQPFYYRGGPLSHDNTRRSTETSILSFAHQLAREVARKQEKINELEKKVLLFSDQLARK